MGALRLTYNQGEEALEKSSLFVVSGLEVNGVSEKNRVRTYRYGFNGQEKDDEVAGAGNSYTAMFWQYDSRLGRRWNLDPKPNSSVSQYAAFANNPIWFSDPLGDTVLNKYEDYKQYKGLEKELKGNITNATTGKERRVAKKAYNRNDNVTGYNNFVTVDNIITGFRDLNQSEFNRVDNLSFGGVGINVVVGISFNLNAPNGTGSGITKIAFTNIGTATNVNTGDSYQLPFGIVNNEINVTLFRSGQTVSTLANEFGDCIFAIEQPATSFYHGQNNTTYFMRPSTNFSFDYEKYIMKGGLKPKTNNY
jgi:RHS repeat-associated protein